METAGALSYGRRVWALAKVSDGADIVEGDTVRPYVLLGTSYDGTMATIAKFTSVRVVCNNTITAAVNNSESQIRVLHSERFNADDVRLQLGIVANQWERFLVQSRKLAGEKMTAEQCDAFVTELLKPYHTGKIDIKDSRAFKRIIELFNGRAIGSDIQGVAGTRWAALNAVTDVVDHERGRSDNTRIESAWFGTGAILKNRALELLSA
jgi:phage/plasmid-like protein (TIGR03299 family)